MKTVSFRLENAQDKDLEEYAKRNHTDKSNAARKVIYEGLKTIKKEEALNNIRLKKWTIWKAAEYCGESYRIFLPTLRKENIPFPLSVHEMELEFNESSSE